MAQLDLLNLRKSFGTTDIIKGVDLHIARGEFVVFVGPSGCGKSTLLRLISGLEDASSGSILIDGRNVTELAPCKREVAMVFQSYALFPHLNVAENIGFGLNLAKTPRAEIDRRVSEVARSLHLEELLERSPRQLSGGQRQRVAIGRSIIRNPRIFLFDEPLSNLDSALRVQMRIEINQLHKRLPETTMVYVTHDQVEAMTLADRIVVLNNGLIEQVGTPMEVYEQPCNPFVAGFIGAPAMNFIPAVINKHGEVQFGDIHIRPETTIAHRGKITLGIRPEHISTVCRQEADFSGTIELVEELGPETLLYVNSSYTSKPLTVRQHDKVAAAEGDAIELKIEAAKMHIFPQ